jgi:hypothetical protein
MIRMIRITAAIRNIHESSRVYPAHDSGTPILSVKR